MLEERSVPSREEGSIARDASVVLCGPYVRIEMRGRSPVVTRTRLFDLTPVR